MDTNKIAEIIRANTVELRDRNDDLVDATIPPNRLINALADYFEAAAVCDCNHPAPHLTECPAKDPFDHAEFIHVATGI